MKIYNYVKIDLDTGETLEEDSFEYYGPLALCGWGGDEGMGEIGGGYGPAEDNDMSDSEGMLDDDSWDEAWGSITGQPSGGNISMAPDEGQIGGPTTSGGDMGWAGGDVGTLSDLVGKTRTAIGWISNPVVAGVTQVGKDIAKDISNRYGKENISKDLAGKTTPEDLQSVVEGKYGYSSAATFAISTNINKGMTPEEAVNQAAIDLGPQEFPEDRETDAEMPYQPKSALTQGAGQRTGPSTALDSGTTTGTGTTTTPDPNNPIPGKDDPIRQGVSQEAQDFMDRTWGAWKGFPSMKAQNPKWTVDKWAQEHYQKIKNDPGVYWGLTKEEELPGDGSGAEAGKKLSDTFKNPYFKFFGESALQKPGYIDSIRPQRFGGSALNNTGGPSIPQQSGGPGPGPGFGVPEGTTPMPFPKGLSPVSGAPMSINYPGGSFEVQNGKVVSSGNPQYPVGSDFPPRNTKNLWENMRPTALG
uniref:Uncharacterized protein n=1 Tax=viral metagenome TaxID=1070528 RepID=A0A6M3INM6_9ZZZZ